MKNSKISEGSGEFAALIKDDVFKIPQVGDTVIGKILTASKAEVRLDIGGVMTGIVRGRELYFEASEYSKLKPGSEIEATVIDAENEFGELELSFRHAGQEKTWQALMEAYEKKQPIKVKISAANRGGLLVMHAQVPAFLPVSQLSPENYPRVAGGDKTKILEKLKSLVGQETEVKIITLDRKDEKLVVSEKDAWQEKQKDFISQYKVGDTVEGRIIAVTGFGVFVNFGGNLEGLIHISELAWQRIEDPSEIYKVGDMIQAQVINIEGAKIFLSAKKLLSDPWVEVAKRYEIGQTVKGSVLKVNPFGLFVELDADIHGLAHVSQLGLITGQKIEDLFKSGDKLDFEIISLDINEHRLGLAMPGKSKERKSKSKTGDKEKSAKTDDKKVKKAEDKESVPSIEKSDESTEKIKEETETTKAETPVKKTKSAAAKTADDKEVKKEKKENAKK
ncbi:MAG TPA: S1 RNA-binding domain-containing protein [bacterium]|nr:S1 RNA-binding domain-containing protein [bacterium]